MGARSRAQGANSRGSGPPLRSTEPRFLAVGRVLRPHGVRGELRVELLTGYPDRLAHHRFLYLGDEVRPYSVERVRLQKEAALIKLAGCDDRDQAETLRGQLLQIPLEKAIPLEEGEYYHFQIVGVEVFTDQGENLGRVVEVLETGANDVYVIRGGRGEVLLPAIEDVVRELDLEGGRMVVSLMPGLLEDD